MSALGGEEGKGGGGERVEKGGNNGERMLLRIINKVW